MAFLDRNCVIKSSTLVWRVRRALRKLPAEVTSMSHPIFNFRRRKVGGIWFVRLGRLQLSFCVCRSFERAYRGGRTVEVARDAI